MLSCWLVKPHLLGIPSLSSGRRGSGPGLPGALLSEAASERPRLGLCTRGASCLQSTQLQTQPSGAQSPSGKQRTWLSVSSGGAAVSVRVHMSRFQPTCLASGSMNLAWVLDPMSLPQCVLPTVLSQSLALWSSHQAYFCSASACSPPGLETCSATCSSGTAGGLGDRVPCSWLLSAVLLLAAGPLGAGDQPKMTLLPWMDCKDPTATMTLLGPRAWRALQGQEALRILRGRSLCRGPQASAPRCADQTGKGSEGRRWCNCIQWGTEQGQACAQYRLKGSFSSSMEERVGGPSPSPVVSKPRSPANATSTPTQGLSVCWWLLTRP